MSKSNELGDVFKRCPSCGHPWRKRSALLGDPDVRLKGYQAWHPDPDLGMFLFNHERCGTTFVIEAHQLRDLYTGPVYVGSKRSTEDCFGFCDFEEHDARLCPAQCECAWALEVLQIVVDWPKDPEPKD